MAPVTLLLIKLTIFVASWASTGRHAAFMVLTTALVTGVQSINCYLCVMWSLTRCRFFNSWMKDTA